ncbi:MAG: hypothetical protein H6861_00050 [Rhodospirillales bacterium]|nr:hypothetical protein [Rhodospirillales bacterium]
MSNPQRDIATECITYINTATGSFGIRQVSEDFAPVLAGLFERKADKINEWFERAGDAQRDCINQINTFLTRPTLSHFSLETWQACSTEAQETFNSLFEQAFDKGGSLRKTQMFLAVLHKLHSLPLGKNREDYTFFYLAQEIDPSHISDLAAMDVEEIKGCYGTLHYIKSFKDKESPVKDKLCDLTMVGLNEDQNGAYFQGLYQAVGKLNSIKNTQIQARYLNKVASDFLTDASGDDVRNSIVSLGEQCASLSPDDVDEVLGASTFTFGTTDETEKANKYANQVIKDFLNRNLNMEYDENPDERLTTCAATLQKLLSDDKDIGFKSRLADVLDQKTTRNPDIIGVLANLIERKDVDAIPYLLKLGKLQGFNNNLRGAALRSSAKAFEASVGIEDLANRKMAFDLLAEITPAYSSANGLNYYEIEPSEHDKSRGMGRIGTIKDPRMQRQALEVLSKTHLLIFELDKKEGRYSGIRTPFKILENADDRDLPMVLGALSFIFMSEQSDYQRGLQYKRLHSALSHKKDKIYASVLEAFAQQSVPVNALTAIFMEKHGNTISGDKTALAPVVDFIGDYDNDEIIEQLYADNRVSEMTKYSDRERDSLLGSLCEAAGYKP